MGNDLEVVLLDDELLLLEEDVDGLGLGQLLPALLGQDRLEVVVPAQLRDLRQAGQIFIMLEPELRIRIRRIRVFLPPGSGSIRQRCGS